MRSPGDANDLVELACDATPACATSPSGPCERNGKEREGAFPATAEALASATPRIAFARPYSVDFTGWLDDFSHSGNYDAMGGFARIGTHVNAFSLKNGVLAPIAPALRGDDIATQPRRTGQNNRCPGSARARPAATARCRSCRSTDFNCDPTQIPPGDEARSSTARRGVVAGAALRARAGAAAATTAGRRYTVELDNAFGLVQGGDVRVAGVNAGRCRGDSLDQRTQKALVEVEITEHGLRLPARGRVLRDAPAVAARRVLPGLPARAPRSRSCPTGGRVPVEQTASTIPPDLIQNIMRLPYRERFRLILNEFGAGLAGRPEDLNEAIRRAVPALRQTARLLRVLANHDR